MTKSQERILDALWSRAVKKVAGDRCERCYKSNPLNSHHCIGRRNKTLRHVIENGVSLCVACHFFAEQNGIAFAKWIVAKRGEEWWTKLEIASRLVKQYKDFTATKKYLESVLDK